MTLEGKVTERLKKLWTFQGAFFFKVHGHYMQRSGMPDLYVSLKDVWRGWIELKAEKREVTLLQRITIRRLRESGDNAVCLRWMNDQWFLDEEDGMSVLCEHDVEILLCLAHQKDRK